MPGLKCADGAERTHLGHAPGVQDLHTEILLEGADHCGRAGGTADYGAVHGAEFELLLAHELEQREPDRGYARRNRYALGLEQLIKTLAVELGAREYHLGAGQSATIGQGPGVGVKHGHNRQQYVAGADIEGVGQRCRVGMDHSGAVRVEHAFRIAGGAGGVAKRGSGALLEFGPLVVARLGSKQVFVAQQVGDGVRGHMSAAGHCDPAFHAFAQRSQFFDQGRERKIEQQVAVFRMIGDIRDLLGKQARIDGVHDRTHAGNAVEGFQMTKAVPGQCGDPVALLYSKRTQRAG